MKSCFWGGSGQGCAEGTRLGDPYSALVVLKVAPQPMVDDGRLAQGPMGVPRWRHLDRLYHLAS